MAQQHNDDMTKHSQWWITDFKQVPARWFSWALLKSITAQELSLNAAWIIVDSLVFILDPLHILYDKNTFFKVSYVASIVLNVDFEVTVMNF